jgi:hypothetical protein
MYSKWLYSCITHTPRIVYKRLCGHILNTLLFCILSGPIFDMHIYCAENPWCQSRKCKILNSTSLPSLNATTVTHEINNVWMWQRMASYCNWSLGCTIYIYFSLSGVLLVEKIQQKVHNRTRLFNSYCWWKCKTTKFTKRLTLLAYSIFTNLRNKHNCHFDHASIHKNKHIQFWCMIPM